MDQGVPLRRQPDDRSIRLRRYPFPFRAALAISNDTDGMDWRAFEDWHAFVSGTGSTPYGDGLGLEVADSFWVWSDTGAFSLRHGAPWQRRQASPEAERIAELARGGWLDTLHSFGDWDPSYQLSRDDMLRAMEVLDAAAIDVPVYINHGNGLRYHNIGGPWATYQGGDDPDSPSYNLDLLAQRGIRFYWTDAMFENERFGDDMLDMRAPPEAALKRWTSVTERVSRTERGGTRAVFPGVASMRVRALAEHLATRLITPTMARDGRAYLGFKRFRGLEAPNTATFGLQATARNLDALEAARGACVIYQHFGVWRALGRAKRHPSHQESRSPLLDGSAVWAFRDIADRHAEGRLLVATTGRLLTFVHLRDTLVYRVEEMADAVDIVVEGQDCPISGRLAVSEGDLAGLGFTVERGGKPVRVRIGDGEPLPTRREADPAEPDRDAIYLPWRRMEFPALASNPPRSLSASWAAGTPPQHDIEIVHRGLSPEQATRMTDMVEQAGRQGAADGPSVREDLQTIVENWKSIEVPPMLASAATYIAKMHAEPFSAYHARLKRLTSGGGVALDAGSGTSTWSFPMADLFDKVIAVDKNRSRVDCARWLVETSAAPRVDVSHGDITELDLPDNSVDFVFCYGVIISAISLRSALREFYRVTRPGGAVYLCLNGIGWSYHLRDERGATSSAAQIQGRRAFYNTFCQVQQGKANQNISRLMASMARDAASTERFAKAIGVTADDLVGFVTSCTTAKTLADVKYPSDGPLSAEALADKIDRLLDEAGLSGHSLTETLADIDRECGPDYVDQFGLDLVSLISGRRDAFSHAAAGRGYAPTEVEALCVDAGFTDYRWAGEGELVGFDGEDLDAPSFFGSEFGGKLGVWELMVRKP